LKTDSEALNSDVVGSGQLRPLTRLQLSLDDRLARRHVLTRHAVRNTDSHRTLQNAYCVSQKIPPEVLWQFFQNGQEVFDQILHAYFAFLSTLDYEFLVNYLQLRRSYAILSVTTQFICAQNVHYRPKSTLAFSDLFPKRLGSFSPNFTHLLSVHIYAIKQIFIQLSPTTTKLCHNKCDHPACVSVNGDHFEHITVVALNMA